jgi:hypothetical protein
MLVRNLSGLADSRIFPEANFVPCKKGKILTVSIFLDSQQLRVTNGSYFNRFCLV